MGEKDGGVEGGIGGVGQVTIGGAIGKAIEARWKTRESRGTGVVSVGEQMKLTKARKSGLGKPRKSHKALEGYGKSASPLFLLLGGFHGSNTH